MADENIAETSGNILENTDMAADASMDAGNGSEGNGVAGGQVTSQGQQSTGRDGNPPQDLSEKPDQEAAAETDAQADPDTTPITAWENVNLDLPKDAQIDEASLAAFGKAAVDMGLTPKQSRELVKFHLGLLEQGQQALQAARDASTKQGVELLAREWGKNADANQKQILAMISQVDRSLGNDKFSKVLNESGALCSADFIKGLHQIATMLAEDSLGQLSQAPTSQQTETAFESIKNAFMKAGKN